MNKKLIHTDPNHKGAWGLDLTDYDRRPDLSDTELSALVPFLPRYGMASNAHWSPDNCVDLHRLMKPIVDVLNSTEVNIGTFCQQVRWHRAIRLLMREMHRRKCTFWAWTIKEWVETLCPNTKTFGEKYKLPPEYRACVTSVAYVFGGFTDFHLTGRYRQYAFATRMFGRSTVDKAIKQIVKQLKSWGYNQTTFRGFQTAISELLVLNRSPRLEDFSFEFLAGIRQRREDSESRLNQRIYAISRVLAAKGIIPEALPTGLMCNETPRPDASQFGVSPEWASWCKRWKKTTPLQPNTTQTVYSGMLIAGRWLNKVHPEITSPAQWTRELAADYIAAVNSALVGQWVSGLSHNLKNKGKPLMPVTKAQYIGAMRTLIRDCIEWEWIPYRFDPNRALATPQSITRLIGPDPRVIDDDVWAKLLWAALNLTAEDMPIQYRTDKNKQHHYYYPLEMMQSLAITWLFAGLRRDEISRLRSGCVRWQRDDMKILGTGEVLPKDSVCMLYVPTNKTSTAFAKPVDRVVGEAIETWEKLRAENPLMLDRKTGEMVNLLYAHRGKRLGIQFINTTLIQLLCRKAGIPRADARGNVTSHRARSTIASQLSNSEEGMTLWEMKEWLGHVRLESTLHYVKPSALKLAKSFHKANDVSRNLRNLGSLIKEEGTTVAKDLILIEITQNKESLQRARQKMNLTGEQMAAIDDTLKAIEVALVKLAA